MTTLETAIVPVQFWPLTATKLVLRTGQFTPPPWYLYSLLDASGSVLAQNSIQMSQADWNAWPAGLGPEGDANYQLDSICRTLNLTRA